MENDIFIFHKFNLRSVVLDLLNIKENALNIALKT